MPLSAKKEPTSSARKKIAQKALESLKKEGVSIVTQQWIDAHDELLDKAEKNPITIEELFTNKLIHKTFSHGQVRETAFDWSQFRQALEVRTASSPRWFIQLREEDLLLGPHGLDGVTVDCFVIAEAKGPTLAPAEYIVKVHWPYSDAEDNAPERILSIADQKMCWRRIVKANNEDINAYLLQKVEDPNAASLDSSSTFGFGLSSTSSTSNAASTPSSGFSFGGSAPPPTSSVAPSSSAPVGFGFGFGTAPVSSAPAASAVTFGFGTSPSAAPISFGFGNSSVSSGVPSAAASGQFSFGTAAVGGNASKDNPAVPTKELKTSEVLFTLWSRERLSEMESDIKSGSRIVSEGFQVHPTISMKLVMQNDVEDDVKATAQRLILKELFAKRDPEVKKMNKWIDDCPVYDEELANALQEFRERRLEELSEESDEFDEMKEKFLDAIEAELQRIIEIRKESAALELEMISSISERIDRQILLEKKNFKLLKYYAKNDLLPFRPFGKISGISEMGESVDVCVPPAHVNINPFTNKPV